MKRKVFLGFILMLTMGIFPPDLSAQLDGKGNAPDFVLTDIDDIDHHMYEYLDSGKVVMIDFFAVWCGICQSNTEVLDAIYEHYGPEGFDKIVLLSLEADDNSTDQEISNYRDQYSVTNPLINETLGTVADYNINGYPFYYIVAPDRSYKVFSGIEMNLEEKVSDAIDNAPGLREVENDLRISEFSSPMGTFCAEQVIPRVMVQNYGRNVIGEFELEIVLDGNTAYTLYQDSILQPYEYMEIDLPELEGISNGWHEISFSIPSVNSHPDAEENNGTITGEFLYLEESVGLEIRINTDNYPRETYWKVFENGRLAAERMQFDKARSEFSDSLCLEEGHCYTLTIFDRFRDGLTRGGATVLYRGDTIAEISSDNFSGESESVEFCLVSGSSGIKNDIQNHFKLEVFPNPVTDILTIGIPDMAEGAVDLTLIDPSGKILLNERIYKFEIKKSLDLSTFSNGIIFLRVAFADQMILKKILIQK